MWTVAGTTGIDTVAPA
ncbi:hypothetical protein E2C01_023569 [Portunus trituberculatus]|uniref:Uncharacterized protein n=1 Tax=Portunus trituberculatus TaxID=210409 RepID=A0A5B7EAC1_PORTR|nr:hypothetical protein [Portunus trituberculatus]